MAEAGVRDSLHNLSAGGPGGVKAVLADRICEFCHISHSARTDAPMWSRSESTAAYIPYSSTTAVAQPGQPTGASLLCLSCHDGTIALGQILNRGTPHSMAGGRQTMPPGRSLQGTDLSDDHPISFQFSSTLAAQNGELAIPGSISPLLPLDGNGVISTGNSSWLKTTQNPIAPWSTESSTPRKASCAAAKCINCSFRSWCRAPLRKPAKNTCNARP